MRWFVVITLMRKEILDTLRDRRTLLVMVLLPMLIYPMLGLFVAQIQMMRRGTLDRSRFIVGVVGADEIKGVLPLIDKRDDVRRLKPNTNWKRLLRRRELALVIQAKVVPAYVDPKTKRHHKQQLILEMAYASTNDASRVVLRRVRPILHQLRKAALLTRLKRHGFDLHFIRPVILQSQDVVSTKGRGRYAMGMLFPGLLIILTVTGAFYPAIDLTAGEKERGTLETLLTAPVSSLEIVTGKYLAVCCMASVAAGLNLLSLWLTFSQGLRMVAGGRSMLFGLHVGHYLLIFGFLLLFAALSAAVMMAIASLARSFKEAQNYVAPAYLLCVLPAMLPSMPGAKATLTMAVVPVVNVAFAIQQAITGQLALPFLALTLASLLASIALALYVAARLFAHEQVLFREGEFSFLGGGEARPIRQQPGIEEALLLLCVLFVLGYYIAMPIQMTQPAWGIVVQMWGLLFGVTIGSLALRRIDLRATLRLYGCSVWSLVGASLMVLGALPIVSALTTWVNGWLFPDWQQFVQRMNETISVERFGVSTLAFYALLALSPAICEELLFRGVVLSSFRKKMSVWTALLLTGVLFGAFHMYPQRLLPTTLLGVMLGWLCWSSGSILPAIWAHFLNNAISIKVSLLGLAYTKAYGSAGPLEIAWLGLAKAATAEGLLVRLENTQSALVFVVGGVLFVLGAAICWRVRSPARWRSGS